MSDFKITARNGSTYRYTAKTRADAADQHSDAMMDAGPPADGGAARWHYLTDTSPVSVEFDFGG